MPDQLEQDVQTDQSPPLPKGYESFKTVQRNNSYTPPPLPKGYENFKPVDIKKKGGISSDAGGGPQDVTPSSQPIPSSSTGQSQSNVDNRPEIPQSGAKISDVLAGVYKPVVATTDQNGIPKPPSIGNGKKTSQLVQAASDLTSTILPSRTGDLTTALNSGNIDAFLGIRDEINGKLSSALMMAKEDNRARQFSGAPAKQVLPIDIQKKIDNSTPIAQMEQHAAQAKDDLNDLATTVIVKNRLPNVSTSINIPQGDDPQVSQAIDESAASDIGKMMKEKLGITYSTQGNVSYDDTKTGLEAIIHTLRLNANDVLADGAANKDPVLLNKAIELSKSIDKNVSLYKELDDHYPDIQLNNTVKYLSDIAEEKGMNTYTAFSSKDVYDLAKIAQERDPNFQTKMGKYVDVIAQGEGEGLLGQLQPGQMIRHDIASQVGRSILEWTAGATSTLEGIAGNTNAQAVDAEVAKNLQSRYTSKEGALHDKVIFDNEGQAYVKKNNEFYGNLNMNSFTRMAANALPGLAEWMVGAGVGSTIVKGLQEAEGLTAAIKGIGGLNEGSAIASASGVQELGGVIAGSYLTGYSANRDIAENVIDDKSGWGDAKKAAFANLATLATAGIFHAIGANPAQVLQQSLTKSVSNDILATLEESNWQSLTKEGVEKLLTESILPRAENILKGAGYSLKEGAKIATAGEVSNKITQLAEIIINPGKAQVTSTEDDVNNITQQTLVMSLLPAFGKLATKGFELPYTAKDALVDAALKDGIIKSGINNKVDSGEYTQEQANGLISLINTMKESLGVASAQTDTKGLPFTQKQAKEWALADFKKKAAIHLRDHGVDVTHIDAETDAAKKDIADQSGYVALHENDIFKSIKPVDKNEEKPKTFLYIHANNEYTATVNGETVTLKGDALQEAIKKDAHDTNNIQSSNTANNESKINQGQNGQENGDNSSQQQGVVQPEQVPGQSDQKGQVDNNGVLVPVSSDAPLPETVVLNGQEYKVKKDNGDGTVNVQKGDDPDFITVKKSELQHMQPKDNITIGDVMDKKVTYKGESATVYQDGQAVIIKIDGKPKEYEIGNVDELKNKPISDFGIEHEQSVVSIDDAGDIKVSGQDYVNDFADPIKAIYKDDNGNLLYVHLKTKDGKDKLFTGNVAEDLAYQITLKEINKSDETRQQFEQFLATDPQFIADTKDAAVQNTTAKEATGDNTQVSRSKVEATGTGTIIRDGQEYADTPRMKSLVERGDKIRESLPPVENGMTRLYRGNRSDGDAGNPSYTNSLEGIALPFKDLYGGELSYVDVSTKDLGKYELKSGTSTGNEFSLPKELSDTKKVINETSKDKVQQSPEVTVTPATETDQNIQQSETKKTDSGKEVVFPSRNGDFAEKFFSKEKVGDATESEYDKWKRLKEDNPEEASKMISDKKEGLLKDVPIPDPESSKPEKTNGISKTALENDYGFTKQFPKVENQTIADNAISELKSKAGANGVSLEQQAANDVAEMKKDKGESTQQDIMTAAFNLRTIDAQIEKANENGTDATHLLLQRDKALEALRDLGHRAGQNLQLFGQVYKISADNSLEVTAAELRRDLGVKEIPRTMQDLKISGLSDADKKKVEPYVQAIEELNKTLKEVDAASSKQIKIENNKEVQDYIEAEVQKRLNDQKPNTPKARQKKSQDLRDIAERIRTGNELDKFRKGPDNGLNIQKSSIFGDIDFKELAAQALEYLAKGVEKGEYLGKLIKEAAVKFRGKMDAGEFGKALSNIVSRASLPKREDTIRKISEIAAVNDAKSITADMVNHGLINDMVNDFIHSDTPASQVINEATKELQIYLPETTKSQVEDALLKRGEFKQKTKSQLRNEITYKAAEVKRLAAAENDMRELGPGVRKETQGTQEIKIAKEAQDFIDEVKNDDSLSAEVKKEHISSIEQQRDEMLKNTRQGVLSNLKDAIDAHVSELDNKIYTSIIDGKQESEGNLLEVKKDLQGLIDKLKPNAENLKDQIDKADQDLKAIIESTKDPELKKYLQDIQKQYHENWQKTSDELQIQSAIEKADASKKEAERRIAAGQYTEIPNTVYDIKRNSILAQKEAESKKAWQKLNSMAIKAKEQQQTKSGIAKWLAARRQIMITSISAIEKVVGSGITKPILDPFIKQTFGRLSALATGVKPTELGRVGSTFKQFKNEESANQFIKKMNNAYVDAVVNYDKTKKDYPEDSPQVKSALNKMLDAELDHNAALPYLFINANSAIDIKQVMLKGATDLDASLGKYKQSSSAERTNWQGFKFWLESVNRTHAAIKSVSHRQALLDVYTENLQNLQDKEGNISEEGRQQAWDAAVLESESGRFGERTLLSDKVSQMKNSTSGLSRNAANFLLPVAKISINITKQGIDMAFPFVEAGFKTLGSDAMKGIELNKKDGIEFNNSAQKYYEGIKRGFDSLPLEQKKYINTLLARGLFGAAQYALVGFGLASGSIKYGGAYDDTDLSHSNKPKGSDGKELGIGEWEINGWRAPKILNMILNHSPYTLPASSAAVIHNVYESKKIKGTKEIKAFGKILNEVYERLPFGSAVDIVHAAFGNEYKLQHIVANEVPTFKNTAELLDKNKKGDTRKVDVKGEGFWKTELNIIKSQTPGLRNTLPTKK